MTETGMAGLGNGLSNGFALDGACAAELVERIRSDDAAAIQELYGVVVRFCRYLFRREAGCPEMKDQVHDLFLSVLDSIKQGELRDPRSLMGFVRTLGRRQVAQRIKSAVRQRRRQREAPLWPHTERPPGPEERLLRRERLNLVRKALGKVTGRQREVLVRFYLLEQTKERICREMNLSQTQFRLVKTRGKAACERAGRMLMATPGAWVCGLVSRGGEGTSVRAGATERNWSGLECPSGRL